MRLTRGANCIILAFFATVVATDDDANNARKKRDLEFLKNWIGPLLGNNNHDVNLLTDPNCINNNEEVKLFHVPDYENIHANAVPNHVIYGHARPTFIDRTQSFLNPRIQSPTRHHIKSVPINKKPIQHVFQDFPAASFPRVPIPQPTVNFERFRPMMHSQGLTAIFPGSHIQARFPILMPMPVPRPIFPQPIMKQLYSKNVFVPDMKFMRWPQMILPKPIHVANKPKILENIIYLPKSKPVTVTQTILKPTPDPYENHEIEKGIGRAPEIKDVDVPSNVDWTPILPPVWPTSTATPVALVSDFEQTRVPMPMPHPVLIQPVLTKRPTISDNFIGPVPRPIILPRPIVAKVIPEKRKSYPLVNTQADTKYSSESKEMKPLPYPEPDFTPEVSQVTEDTAATEGNDELSLNIRNKLQHLFLSRLIEGNANFSWKPVPMKVSSSPATAFEKLIDEQAVETTEEPEIEYLYKEIEKDEFFKDVTVNQFEEEFNKFKEELDKVKQQLKADLQKQLEKVYLSQFINQNDNTVQIESRPNDVTSSIALETTTQQDESKNEVSEDYNEGDLLVNSKFVLSGPIPWPLPPVSEEKKPLLSPSKVRCLEGDVSVAVKTNSNNNKLHDNMHWLAADSGNNYIYEQVRDYGAFPQYLAGLQPSVIVKKIPKVKAPEFIEANPVAVIEKLPARVPVMMYPSPIGQAIPFVYAYQQLGSKTTPLTVVDAGMPPMYVPQGEVSVKFNKHYHVKPDGTKYLCTEVHKPDVAVQEVETDLPRDKWVYVPPISADPQKVENEASENSGRSSFSYHQETHHGVYNHESVSVDFHNHTTEDQLTNTEETVGSLKQEQDSWTGSPIVVDQDPGYTYEQENADGSSMTVKSDKENISVTVNEGDKETPSRGDIPEAMV